MIKIEESFNIDDGDHLSDVEGIVNLEIVLHDAHY